MASSACLSCGPALSELGLWTAAASLGGAGAGRCLPSLLSAGGGNKSDVPRKRGRAGQKRAFRPSLRWTGRKTRRSPALATSPPDAIGSTHAESCLARVTCAVLTGTGTPVRQMDLLLSCLVCPGHRCLPDPLPCRRATLHARGHVIQYLCFYYNPEWRMPRIGIAQASAQ